MAMGSIGRQTAQETDIEGGVSENCYRPADLVRWAKMPFWTCEELACVTLGFEPAPIFKATDQQQQSDRATMQKILDRIDQAQRAQEMGYLLRQIKPIIALNWLQALDEPFPPKLLEVAANLPTFDNLSEVPAESAHYNGVVSRLAALEAVASSPKDIANQSSQTRVISTLRKIILIMAVDKYRYDPDKTRNTAPRSIQDAAAKIELTISDDAVRSHLEQAGEEHWLGPFD